jgi:ATPase subunit of ABC transporter with duplicated ATPase domains
MALQSFINEAANQLNDAFQAQKIAKQGLKELKKALKEKLESDSKYQELLAREKKLKEMRKEMSEDLQEIKKEKEQMAMDTDEQREIDEFIEVQETKFLKIKDTVIVDLSRKVADEGMVAEIHYKNGQLIFIVARS